MSANFWSSSHANAHLHPRSALVTARVDDLKHATEQELGWIEIWSASAITKLCKRLGLRQTVVSTAVVFFRRFYLRNSYCDTDSALVAAACCYVGAKAEETPIHIKSAVAEARVVFNDMGLLSFPSDNTKLAEMEFYLIEELDFHLIIFHPYRSLIQLTGRDGGPAAGGEVGKATRAAMLEMDDTALQMAWFVINDTFRSSLCLIHPPHLIAIAAIYLAFSLHPPPSSSIAALSSTGPSSRTRRQSIDSAITTPARTGPPPPGGQTDPITFLATLDIDHTLVLEIVQDVISLYELWNALESTAAAAGAAVVGGGGKGRTGTGKTTTVGADEKVVGILARMRLDRAREIASEREKGRGTPSWKK